MGRLHSRPRVGSSATEDGGERRRKRPEKRTVGEVQTEKSSGIWKKQEGEKEEIGGGEQEPGEGARVRFGGWGFSLVGGEKGGTSTWVALCFSPWCRHLQYGRKKEQAGRRKLGQAQQAWPGLGLLSFCCFFFVKKRKRERERKRVPLQKVFG